ncbi:MAG: hypothetical protein JSW26_02880 [Desulfobacterales bacterium]|nr:MAG: hypothetical protein JSW26_02880 [Desulfobacterales bacterium]
MILSETELFRDIASEVMNKITAVSKEEEHSKGAVLGNLGTVLFFCVT